MIKKNWYLIDVVQDIPNRESIIVRGDFSWQVGKRWDGYDRVYAG